MASVSGAPRYPKGPPRSDPANAPTRYVSNLVESSVGGKILVALTGLGLAAFVVFHMIGNLKVFSGPDSINGYAYFLKHDLGMLIWIGRAGLLGLFVAHLSVAIRLKRRSVAARPVPYQFAGNVQATIASRTMILTGAVIGLFTLFHLAHFTFCWVQGAEIAPGRVVSFLELKDEKGRHDVYSMVVAGFRSPGLAVLYVIAQFALFAHLLHGIPSSFQTLGLKNRRFAGPIRYLGLAVALVVLVGNLTIVIGVLAGFAPPLYKMA